MIEVAQCFRRPEDHVHKLKEHLESFRGRSCFYYVKLKKNIVVE